MEIPFVKIRTTMLRMVMALLRNSHRQYYPDLRFAEGTEAMLISNTIFLAQVQGKPFTVLALSKHLDMPRATLLRRLHYLESKNFVRRDADQRLEFNTELLQSWGAGRTLLRGRRIVLVAARMLSKMDIGKSTG